MHDRRSSSDAAFTVVTILIAVAVLGVVFSMGRGTKPGQAQTQPPAQKQEDPGLAGRSTAEIVDACTTDMATQFHIHPHLTIMIDGVKQEVPANIGIANGCMHPLHTHDASGELHVESPVKRDFTLGDFFHVWGKPFDSAHLLDKVVDAGHVLTETVNGKEVADLEKTVLRDKDDIVLSYGKK